MAERAEVTKLPDLLPDKVTISGAPDIRMTPNQMRALKAETGRTLDELMGEGADEADRLQAMVWLELRKQGINAPWDRLGDVAIELQEDEPDPTKNGG